MISAAKSSAEYRLWVDATINGHNAVVGVEVKGVGRNIEVNAIDTVFGGDRTSVKKDNVVYSRKNGEGLRTLLGKLNSSEYSETPSSSKESRSVLADQSRQRYPEVPSTSDSVAQTDAKVKADRINHGTEESFLATMKSTFARQRVERALHTRRNYGDDSPYNGWTDAKVVEDLAERGGFIRTDNPRSVSAVGNDGDLYPAYRPGNEAPVAWLTKTALNYARHRGDVDVVKGEGTVLDKRTSAAEPQKLTAADEKAALDGIRKMENDGSYDGPYGLAYAIDALPTNKRSEVLRLFAETDRILKRKTELEDRHSKLDRSNRTTWDSEAARQEYEQLDKRHDEVNKSANDTFRKYAEENGWELVDNEHSNAELRKGDKLTTLPPPDTKSVIEASHRLKEADKAKNLALLKDVPTNEIVQALIQFGIETVTVKERGVEKPRQRWSNRNINDRVSRLLMPMQDR